MNNEQLKKGKELSEKIERIETQIKKWEDATGIFGISFTKVKDSWVTKTQDIQNVETYPIDFNVLKTLSLKNLEEKLQEVKKEFENL